MSERHFSQPLSTLYAHLSGKSWTGFQLGELAAPQLSTNLHHVTTALDANIMFGCNRKFVGCIGGVIPHATPGIFLLFCDYVIMIR